MKATKRIKRIINTVIWTLIGSYLLLIIAIQLPAVQRFIGNKVENVLSKKLGTNVDIGRIHLGFLNRLIIDDITIQDQRDKDMLSASRLSAKFDLMALMKGEIDISSAQIFGLNATLYKKDTSSQHNFQFLIDSLQSKETDKKSKLSLNINSLVIRHGNIKYDRYDVPSTAHIFNPQHLDIKDLSAHLILEKLTDDSLSLKVKRLAFKEGAGLDVQNVVFKLTATKENAKLENWDMQLPHTHIQIPEVAIERLSTEKLFYGRIETSVVNFEDLKPVARYFADIKNDISPLTISATFNGNKEHVNIEHISVVSKKGDLNLIGNGYVNNLSRMPNYYANIRQFSTDISLLKGFNLPYYSQISPLGNVQYQGEVGKHKNELFVKGELKSNIGNVKTDLTLNENNLKAKISTQGIYLNKLFQNEHFGMLATDMNVEGNPKENNFKMSGKISRIDYGAKTYQNIDIDGTYKEQAFTGKLAINDANGNMQLDGNIDLSSATPEINATANIHQFNIASLPFNKKWHQSKVSLDGKINIKGKSISNMTGSLELNNFNLQSPEENYYLQSLNIKSGQTDNKQIIDIDGDFGKIQITGNYDYNTLRQSITNAVKDKLPTLPGLPSAKNIRPNHLTLTADINKTDWLKPFFDIDFTLNAPMHIAGIIDDSNKSIDLTCNIPEFIYNESQYNETDIKLKTIGDTLSIDGSVKKLMNNGNLLDLAVNAKAANNKLKTDISIDNHEKKHHLYGIISTETQFFKNEVGIPVTHTIIHPSALSVNEETWYVEPSDIVYSNQHLVIDHFAVQNGNQHVIISGVATPHEQDSINIDLNNVDVTYLSDILNVKDVRFGGNISGKANITSVFGNTAAKALLDIEDFTFVEGRLGALHTSVDWNKNDNIINIHGKAEDGPFAQTLINGEIALSPGHLDLNCDLQNTRIEFLESYLDGILHQIEARADGNIHIFGPLETINLEGNVVANGDVGVKSLNTRYTLHNDTIKLFPNHLVFRSDSVLDKDSHIAVLNGDIFHNNLKDWIFDLNIEANNILAYDFKNFGDDSFCGTVYATGTCHISNQTHDVVLDIEATPNENSIFKYNAASPNSVKNQEFIHWNDVTDRTLYGNTDVRTDKNISPRENKNNTVISTPSNLYINFLINTTPDLTLRVIMNEESGDYIDLNGNGVLQANYFNKGAFNIFGNYIVDHGVYKMTIQNIIKKEFTFQEGGTIAFGGDPYDAALNLQALYVVNGVSLSDLNIGRSFASNNTRVNCLMNITGSPSSPKADFDLQLPTVSNDAQQMVRSLINSEEELNQQVIYLLTIGRFYTQGTNNANQDNSTPSQASLAMQSLLSGTLSQQINTVLSSVLNNNNWNFGANISTGAEGWNNAEYEGILSGRLLNNRLLINGQFGYRDNPNATTSFIGDFDIRYLLFPNGNLAVKVYNQTNDRYFTRNSLNTQGLGLIIKKDFNNFKDLFGRKKKTARTETTPTDSIQETTEQ